MGKQSSAKKVKRAARAGGSSAGRSFKWGFPAAIIAVLVVGVGLVAFAMTKPKGSETPPQISKDHWHSAQAVWLCDHFLETPLQDVAGDKLGIHTHGDGLIHIHPFSANAAGKKATLGVFAEDVGIQFGDDSFTLPDGSEYKTGDDCMGEKGTVEVVKWSAGDLAGDPEVITSDFGAVRFLGNGEAYTIAFVKPDQDLKELLPPSVSQVNNPGDLSPGETAPPSVAVPEGANTTAGLDASVSPDGTAPATTVAPADPTPTTGGQ
jgi:hypothetical protein